MKARRGGIHRFCGVEHREGGLRITRLKSFSRSIVIRLPALTFFCGKVLIKGTLEGRASAPVGSGLNKENLCPNRSGHLNHAVEVESVVLQNLLLSFGVAHIGVWTQSFVQNGIDLPLEQLPCFFLFPSGLGQGFDPSLDQCGGAQMAGGTRHPDQACGKTRTLVVDALLEKLVVPGVNDKHIRLVGQQLLHQAGHPIAGVTDPSGINNFHGSLRRSFGNQRTHPSGERGRIAIGTPVGGGASQRENPQSASRLYFTEALIIEKHASGGHGPHPQLPLLIRPLFEQRRVTLKADVGIRQVGLWPDTHQGQETLHHPKGQQHGGASKEKAFGEGKFHGAQYSGPSNHTFRDISKERSLGSGSSSRPLPYFLCGGLIDHPSHGKFSLQVCIHRFDPVTPAGKTSVPAPAIRYTVSCVDG